MRSSILNSKHHVCEHHADERTTDLGHNDHQAEQEIFGPFGFADVEAHRDSWVEMATGNASENIDDGEKGQGWRYTPRIAASGSLDEHKVHEENLAHEFV